VRAGSMEFDDPREGTRSARARGSSRRADKESRLQPAGATQGWHLGLLDPAARPVPGG